MAVTTTTAEETTVEATTTVVVTRVLPLLFGDSAVVRDTRDQLAAPRALARCRTSGTLSASTKWKLDSLVSFSFGYLKILVSIVAFNPYIRRPPYCSCTCLKSL